MEIVFKYDEQTFHDLEILKGHQDASVFTLFNNTLTEGGDDFLKQLFRNPITDLEELERRGKLIQFFIDKPLELAISSRQIKFIEKYINLNYEVLKSNPIDSFYLRISEWFRPSNEYYLVETGCVSLIQVLYELNQKLHQDSFPKELKPFTITQLELMDELGTDLNAAPKFSWKRVIQLDQLFRIKYAKKLKSLLQEIYVLDAYVSVAKTASERAFTLPTYEKSSKPILFAKELKHPLIEGAIANDVEIGLEENMCFLTGPNMAGKSTFLKSIGISVFLSHLGFPVPAKEFRTTLYSGMITTINLSDKLSIGYSHFYSEVKRVKESAKALAGGNTMLVIFDELFRGTNVKDAFEASSEIIKGFADVENCTFFVSTHIVEIADEINSKPNISFKYFESELIHGELRYSYKLKTGVSSERLGMYIVKKEGIFDLLKSIKKPVTDA